MNCIGWSCLLSFEVPKYKNSYSTSLGSCFVIVFFLNSFFFVQTWKWISSHFHIVDTVNWPSTGHLKKYFEFIGFVCVFFFLACLLFHFGMLPHNHARKKSWCFEIFSNEVRQTNKTISQFVRSKKKCEKNVKWRAKMILGICNLIQIHGLTSKPKRYPIPQVCIPSCCVLYNVMQKSKHQIWISCG